METLPLPADVKVWAEAQVAAGRASSVAALAAAALATLKAQQDAIAAGPDALTSLRAWLAEEER